MALSNLAKEKTFQFRKHLINHSLMKSVESHYERYSKSDEAKKIISDYNKAMNNMYIHAKIEYNTILNRVKATKDPVLKQKILNDYANKGITGFIAKNGARWTLESYSNMYSRHANNQLVRQQVLDQVEEQKRKYVKISVHGTICHICKPYEGKVLTLKELDIARANGLFHPNCLHLVLHVINRGQQ